MKLSAIATTFLLLVLATPLLSQNTPEFERCVSAKYPVFVDVNDQNFIGKIKPEPPNMDKKFTASELDELHRIERERTPAQASQANADANELDMFIFRTIFGAQFNRNLFKKAAALSDDVCVDATLVTSVLKYSYPVPRSRPFRTDPKLKLACDPTAIFDSPSYPSGHAITGYLEALTLIEMVPEKQDEILKRAKEYSENRMVCGVHYPSDVEAGRVTAYAVFRHLKTSPLFNAEWAAACTETRDMLGLDPKICDKNRK